jgi:hypothetical protein
MDFAFALIARVGEGFKPLARLERIDIPAPPFWNFRV